MTAVPPWDAFTATEAQVRAMVADPRWQGLSLPDRAHVLAARILVTPDGDRWLFGAHARWHLYDPADGRWHLAPPPRGTRAREVGHAAAALPDAVVPDGYDFHAEPGSTQSFIGPDVPEVLTEQIRSLVRSSGRKSELDYPLTAFDEIFGADVPSTVAAVWGTIMWCAYAPAFDGNERLITIFGEYLRRSLPGDEWVRWLPAPPLRDLVTLVAERLRAGRSREALRLAAVMADTAQILLLDTRFRPRALALLTMVEPVLRRPGLDDPYEDDEAVRRAWLERCPARLCRALLVENDPGAHFSHTVYDLVDALSFTPGPREAAATFLADLSDSKGRCRSGWTTGCGWRTTSCTAPGSPAPLPPSRRSPRASRSVRAASPSRPRQWSSRWSKWRRRTGGARRRCWGPRTPWGWRGAGCRGPGCRSGAWRGRRRSYAGSSTNATTITQVTRKPLITIFHPYSSYIVLTLQITVHSLNCDLGLGK
ncbi:hypothetical protein ACFQYP_54800 [Nonomuraea antimicrobica]